MEVCQTHKIATIFSLDTGPLFVNIFHSEDLLAFKADVEKCCKFISKMRGKKASGSAILEAFNHHLEQEFPDVFPPEMEVEEEAPVSTKKRGRPSLADSALSLESPERQPKKKAAKLAEDEVDAAAVSGLGASEKVQVSLVDRTAPVAITCSVFIPADCFEGDHSETSEGARGGVLPLSRGLLVSAVSPALPLLTGRADHRVAFRLYPEYYELIKHPMDLDTAKRKATHGEYSSVEEALQDLRQIWENCRIFNAEGSEILQSAEACAELTEALVEVGVGNFTGTVLELDKCNLAVVVPRCRRNSARNLCRRRKAAARAARAP